METYGIAAIRRLNHRLYLSKTAIGGSFCPPPPTATDGSSVTPQPQWRSNRQRRLNINTAYGLGDSPYHRKMSPPTTHNRGHGNLWYSRLRRLNYRLCLSKTAIGGSHRKKINDDTARHKELPLPVLATNDGVTDLSLCKRPPQKNRHAVVTARKKRRSG